MEIGQTEINLALIYAKITLASWYSTQW